MFKVNLDKEKCIGCGTCVAICPGNYEMGKDGKAFAVKEEIMDLGGNRMAEENCPVVAISIRPIAEKKEDLMVQGEN